MKIDREVFNSKDELVSPATFNACMNAHGLYHSRQFVLRLSPLNHQLMKTLEGKQIVRISEVGEKVIQAYSTYVHENIHWWQHKGSISGFIRSSVYLAFSHVNMDHLKELTSITGPIKPVFKWWDAAQRRGEYSGTRAEFLSNTIINNFLDIEFFLAQTYNSEILRSIAQHPYFESVAHCTWIAYSHVVNDIAFNIDKKKIIFPETEGWEDNFADCRAREITGHYYGSPICLTQVGLIDILEGQARMIQLQYLCFGKGGLSLASARDQGYFKAEYGRAFDFFLSRIGVGEPMDMNDPLIALFLLLCDIALNPDEGFLKQIRDYENFHKEVDPGYRFMILCGAIAVDLPHLKEFIKNYTKEEYIVAAGQICDACGYSSPYEIALEISSWEDRSEEVFRLMTEHKEFKFGAPNPATRILLSELISFCKDKSSAPHFFCWPGAWLAGTKTKDEYNALWLKNLALYSDQGNSDTIVPREIQGCTNEAVNEAFNNFYGAVMGYDFMRQWIYNEGGFNIDYKWLIQLDDPEELRVEVRKFIYKQFGVNVSDFSYI